jgi:acetyl-CoA C-acetyltransferase
MPTSVAIIGVGAVPAQPLTPFSSFKELMFQAAERAYADAGVEAHAIDSFVTCAEDFNEGVSIFDEYTPDQLGAVQKPMHTVTADGLHGLADAVMQIRSGLVDLVVVEAHSKASNLVAPGWILAYALDPVYTRPLGFNPHALAGLEMQAFLHETGVSADDVAHVVAKNRGHALRNPLAAYPARVHPADVVASPYTFYPLRAAETAQTADGCVVLVLASEARAKAAPAPPVWVRGIGFANDSPTVESRPWSSAEAVRRAAKMAYRQAGIDEPARAFDLVEVDDTYAYKELQHLVALGLFEQAGAAARATASGQTTLGGPLPVNVSGGALGMGHTLEATGLYRVVELVTQLRGHADARQVAGARVGLAQSWRGVPTTSAAVVVLAADTAT